VLSDPLSPVYGPRPVVQDDGRCRVTRVTDDPAVVIERDTAIVAVELGAEEREAGRIGRHGVPQRHPATVIENAALRAEVVRAGHGPGSREPVRVSLARPV
jgi:hypothetical protein